MIKLLSIDDQRDNQITIRGALSSYLKGATFYFALSGKEGIDMAHQYLPDIILLDIMMPGMDGFETCRLIKEDEQLKYIPVILLSAIGNKTENRIKGMEIGADAIMSKPFDPAELAAQIRVMLRIKSAEDKLRKENQKLDQLVEEKISQIVYQATVLENVSDAVISADTDFILKSWNEAAEKTYGWKEAEVMGKSYDAILRPIYPEGSRNQVVEYFRKHGKYSSEVVHHHKNGDALFILTSVSKILDKDGNNIGTVALNRDITKEKTSESQIVNLTARLELAVKAVELGIWEWDLISNKFSYNDEFAVMYGIDESEPLPPMAMLKKYLYVDDFAHTVGELRKLARTGEKIVIEHRVNNPIKGIITVTSKAVREADNTGKILKIIGVSYDITHRKQMEDKLKQSEERYRLLVETSNDLVWITDKNGCFSFYNEHVEDVTGYQFDRFIGKSYELLLPEANREWVAAEYAKVLAGEKTQIETTVYFAGGVEHILWINMAPIYEDGKVVGVASFARDMSDYRLAMEELKLALQKAKESDRLKSAFLATMSHELRTPLNAIIGFSSLLDSGMDKEEFQSFATIIGDSGQHLLALVEDIFDITLIESGEIKLNNQVFELMPVIDQMVEFGHHQQGLLNRQGIELVFHQTDAASNISIFGDKRRFQQVWQNLIKNALKFTESGKITTGFETVTEGGKPMVRFYVTDTGIGISKEKQNIIFEAFRQADDTHTRKYDGVGIGLSVVKKLTELMGGTISLSSEVGVGSTFWFTIPRASAKHLEQKNEADQSRFSFNGKKILVAEDDVDSYHFLELVLLKYDAVPVWAHNGREALNYCAKNDLPWMVLMDLNMPVMNGIDATAELKKLYPDLVIIAQTAYTLGDDMAKAVEAGCNEVVPKPIIIDRLISTMAKYLETNT